MSTPLRIVPPPGTCPPPEELAAFLDGKLTGNDHARILGHIGTCDRCHDVFVDAVELLEEEAAAEQERDVPSNVVPFPVARPGRPVVVDRPAGSERGDTAYRAPKIPALPRMRWRWAQLAASLAAVAGLGGWWLLRAATDPAGFAEQLLAAKNEPQRRELKTHLRQDSPDRGEGGARDDGGKGPRLGAQWLDLELSLRAGDSKLAAGYAKAMQREIADDEQSLDPATVEFFEKLGDRLAAPDVDPQAVLSELARRRADLTGRYGEEEVGYGAWAEAGRVAAASGDAAFLYSRSTRRMLRRLLAEDNAVVDPEVRPDLKEVQRVLAQGNPQEADLGQISERLAAVIDTF